MTRASFLIALALSGAALAQQPPPLPLPPMEKAEPKKDAAKKDLPPPPLPLPGTTAAKPAPITLPGVEAQKPPAPPAAKPAPAATAQKPPAATPAHATTAAEKPKTAAAPAAPMAASAVQVNDLRLRPSAEEQLWTIRGFVGGERSNEQSYTEAAAHTRLGAEVTRWFSGTWLVRGEFDWRSSNQGYVPLHSATNTPVKVDENRFDAVLALGFDVGPRMAQSGRLELTPMIGVAYVGIRNQAFPSDLVGPNFGARARWSLSSAVIAHATVAYTFNLAVASVQNSALKSPKGDVSTRAGLALPLSGGYTLELDYSGDVLAFENTFRVAHGAALGFGTSF